MIDIVGRYFVRWGYAIVFGACLFENSAFIGAVVPGDAVLLLAGFYVQRSRLNLAPVVALAFVGAIIGDSFGYMIGRKFGRRLVDRFGQRLLPQRRLERIDRYFKEYGTWAVAMGRITPIVRTFNTFTAGMAKMPFPRFIAAVAGAAAVSSVAMPVVGFLFSGSLEIVRRALGWAGVVILVIFVGGLVFTYRRMAKRLAEETLGEDG